MLYPYNKKTKVLDSPSAQGYLLAQTPNEDLVELHIAANAEVAAHALPVDVCFYVLSGKGRITIANEELHLKSGDTITVKSQLQRAWQNTGNSILKLLVIKQK